MSHRTLARLDAAADALEASADLARSIALDAHSRAGEEGAAEYADERLALILAALAGLLRRARTLPHEAV